MLEITGLRVRYGDFVAVDGVDLSVDAGEVMCVVGPSGCGKSTLLRAVAGLEVPDAGRVVLDGVDLGALRPDQRRVGLMFQDHALFPHRDVAANVAFGLRMQGVDADDRERRVAEALELVGLGGYGDRRVTELSGGEQQRVALARTIAPRPRLLMLDEPLGSLDRALRDRLLVELPTLFDELGTTVVYVTHDQAEALALADRVAVMHRGRMLQVGPTHEVWRAPTSEFVARFLGLGPILDATVRDGVANAGLGEFPADGRPDGPARVVLLPTAAELVLSGDDVGGTEADRQVPAEVSGRTFAGDHVVVHVTTGAGVELRVPVWRGPAPHVGEQVAIRIDPDETRVLDAPAD